MIRIFLDTNVMIDYLARREKFYQNAALVISLCEEKDIQILVSALSFATTSYILSSYHKMSGLAIKSLFQNFVKASRVTPIDSIIVEESMYSDFEDFEDAMQYYSALRGRADMIITRNKDDFEISEIPVYEPQEFLDKMMNDR